MRALVCGLFVLAACPSATVDEVDAGESDASVRDIGVADAGTLQGPSAVRFLNLDPRTLDLCISVVGSPEWTRVVTSLSRPEGLRFGEMSNYSPVTSINRNHLVRIILASDTDCARSAVWTDLQWTPGADRGWAFILALNWFGTNSAPLHGAPGVDQLRLIRRVGHTDMVVYFRAAGRADQKIDFPTIELTGGELGTLDVELDGDIVASRPYLALAGGITSVVVSSTITPSLLVCDDLATGPGGLGACGAEIREP